MLFRNIVMITVEHLIYDIFRKSSLYIGELKRIFLIMKIFIKKGKMKQKVN